MSTRVKVARIPDCDICTSENRPNVAAEYDGKTKFGPWANMCDPCYRKHGIGLGTGKGQRLELQ